jgi:phosphate transport system permease protein
MAALDATVAAAAAGSNRFEPPANLGARKRSDQFFVFWGFLATVVGLLVLGTLVVDLFFDAGDKLTAAFFTNFPATDATEAGILSAWVGSIFGK